MFFLVSIFVSSFKVMVPSNDVVIVANIALSFYIQSNISPASELCWCKVPINNDLSLLSMISIDICSISSNSSPLFLILVAINKRITKYSYTTQKVFVVFNHVLDKVTTSNRCSFNITWNSSNEKFIDWVFKLERVRNTC